MTGCTMSLGTYSYKERFMWRQQQQQQQQHIFPILKVRPSFCIRNTQHVCTTYASIRIGLLWRSGGLRWVAASLWRCCSHVLTQTYHQESNPSWQVTGQTPITLKWKNTINTYYYSCAIITHNMPVTWYLTRSHEKTFYWRTSVYWQSTPQATCCRRNDTHNKGANLRRSRSEAQQLINRYIRHKRYFSHASNSPCKSVPLSRVYWWRIKMMLMSEMSKSFDTASLEATLLELIHPPSPGFRMTLISTRYIFIHRNRKL